MVRLRYVVLSILGSILLAISPVVNARAPVSKAADSAMNQRLDRVEQLLSSRGLLDLLQQLENLQQEVDHLRGEMELQTHHIEQLKKRQRSLYIDIDQRLQRIERSGQPTNISDGDTTGNEPPLQTLAPVFEPPSRPASQQLEKLQSIEVIKPEPLAQIKTESPTVTDVVVTTNTTADAGIGTPVEIDPKLVRTDYQKAFSLLKQSRYDQAIKAFRGFISRYPVSEYSDNAQYWLGEANYVMHQYDLAVIEYEKLVSNYPNSQKVTHALLKIGYSYYELGQLSKARRYLEELKQRYPSTTAARLARERLQKIINLEFQSVSQYLDL